MSTQVYLCMVAFIVMAAFVSGILQTRISLHVYQETQAFAHAESALLFAESHISKEQASGSGKISAEEQYQFAVMPQESCGLYYKVLAVGHFAQASAQVGSIFVFPKSGEHPCTDATDTPHRVLWFN